MENPFFCLFVVVRPLKRKSLFAGRNVNAQMLGSGDFASATSHTRHDHPDATKCPPSRGVTSGREVDEPAHDGHAAWPPPGLDCIISPITDFQLNWARFKVSGS